MFCFMATLNNLISVQMDGLNKSQSVGLLPKAHSSVRDYGLLEINRRQVIPA